MTARTPTLSGLSPEQLAIVEAAAATLGVQPGALTFLLRTSNSDGLSYNGFRWPAVGGLAKPDLWMPQPSCGYGLHGYGMGEGQHAQISRDDDALWQLVAVVASEVVVIIDDEDRKCKVPRAVPVCVGTRAEVIGFLLAVGADAGAVPGGTVGATGDSGAASATGYSGAASATGDSGAASATGYRGAASATGDSGAASAT
ncbi:MAG: hypothetical protein IT356_12570, partial [Gemmatimonadaceae bacterium]|nr:hypothetical protein [Gemmatimonadaceae bacterium]